MADLQIRVVFGHLDPYGQVPYEGYTGGAHRTILVTLNPKP